MSADGEVETPDTDVDFTYEDALSTTFKILSPSDVYRKNAEAGTWTDMSDDANFMASKVDSGIDLRIVGVVKPNETANSSALSPGIAYTHALTLQLMDRAANSQIVREQLAHPDTDVFTGKTFDELQREAKQGVTWAVCSRSTRPRSKAHSLSMRPRSPVRPPAWIFPLLISLGSTSTFLA